MPIYGKTVMPASLSIDQLWPGQTHQMRVMVSQEMMIAFTRSLGDHQSFHQDPEMAKRSFFGRMVAPGMLTASLIGRALGTEFPGLGTIYVSQELKFVKPVFAGDLLTISLAVLEIMAQRNRVRLDTTVLNQEGLTVLSGRAEIIPPAKQQT
ncbi:MAG: MaoC family dehydratase [Desulfarculus sp.]|nr:MaoC family dehydratase [Desulfarculus sp.]